MFTLPTRHMITPIILLDTSLAFRTRSRRLFDCFLRSLLFFFPSRGAGDAVIVSLACFADVPWDFVVHTLA